MNSEINRDGQIDRYRKVAKLILSKHFGDEILDTIRDNDELIAQYGRNVLKAREAQYIINKVIKPLDNMCEQIDAITSFVEFILKFNESIDNLDAIKSYSERLGIDIDKDTIHEIKSENKAKFLIDFLIKSGLEHKEQQALSELLDTVKDDLALRHGFGTDNYGDTPSIISFLNTIKEELKDYKDNVEHTPIDGDCGAILKVEFANRLKEQKKNGYIELPYYEQLLTDLTNKGRPGKIGQIVLKGPPGTGKTSIFYYKSGKEQKPHRIISMHQYINFYELILQNTNLSPTKNQLEFFKEVIADYQSLQPSELVDRLTELFQINKGNFPTNYTLIDFINTVFNINRFIKDKKQDGAGLLDQSDLNDHDKIQKHILTMLNYWKDEKIYKLLVAKKELVKGEILDAMEKNENVVLDEIDKVQEKEIEGLLAFLDLNTGQYHQIQGMEEKIYIPDGFSIYATSNDKFRPSGPLGRRFNSIDLEYLDKKNTACYIAAKVSNSDLTTPFSGREIDQIVTVIDIIQENQNKKKYSALDFSVRMIDTFISNFISNRNHIVEKKHTNKSSTYIIEALVNAFQSQTQDVYGGNQGSSIDNQKKKLLNSITKQYLNKDLDEDNQSEPVIIGKKLNTSSQGKIKMHIKNFGYDNPLLDLIINTQQEEIKDDRRMLHYPDQVWQLLQSSDKSLSKISPISEMKMNIEPVDALSIDEENYSVEYNANTKQLVIITSKNLSTSKTERFICDQVYTNSAKDTFIVFSATGNKYISIGSGKNSEISNLSEKLHFMNNEFDNTATVDKIIFTTKNDLFWCRYNHEANDLIYAIGKVLEIPDASNMKFYDHGLFGVSHDKKNGMIIGFDSAKSENTSPFKDKIERMQPFLKFNLTELGFEEYEIQGVAFDSTGKYLLVQVNNGAIKNTLPIKL